MYRTSQDKLFAIVVTYSNAYGRFSVADNVCGFSMANTDVSGNVAAQNAVTQASIFATGNGVPPTSGVNLVYNDAQGGPKLDLLAVSPSTGQAAAHRRGERGVGPRARRRRRSAGDGAAHDAALHVRVAPPITAANVPPIAANPPATDRITFDRTTRTLHGPD